MLETCTTERGGVYTRRSPKGTLLHETVSKHLPELVAELESPLPDHVEAEFDAYLKCGVLSHGFVLMTCTECKSNLFVPLSCKRRGFCPSCIGKRMNEGSEFFVSNVIPHVPVRQWVLSFPIPARFWMAKNPRLMGSLLNIFIRAVKSYYRQSFMGSVQLDPSEYSVQTGFLTVIQRFGGALNANIHFHTLALDGVYVSLKALGEAQVPIFIQHQYPQTKDIEDTLKIIQTRMVRHLIKRGLLSKYEDDPVTQDTEPTLMDQLQGASVLGLIGMGENSGKKVRRVGSFGHEYERAFKSGPLGATLAGFSLHAATQVKAEDRERLEGLCRYLLRPPISEKRLSSTPKGDLRLKLKSEWSDGTYAVEFTPKEFIEKLIAIIPHPRIHQTRFHGILAASAEDRPKVVPARIPPPVQGELFEVPKQRPKRMSWAELLKRTFKVDLTVCALCGGEVKYQKVVLKKSEILETLSAAGLSPTPE